GSPGRMGGAVTAALTAPLSSEAASLLLVLTAGGVELRRVGDDVLFRPANAVPSDVLAALRAAKPDLLALLDDGVEARRATFMQQSAAVTPPALPGFIFRPGVPWTP